MLPTLSIHSESIMKGLILVDLVGEWGPGYVQGTLHMNYISGDGEF